ncbi:Uncharacterised protein [Vibrio cholerae]|nr:Uncharacterised protein [Vibrio cholerae]
MERANRFVLEECNESYILYAPCLNVYRVNVINSVDDFYSHYENLLSKYPVDEHSYYNRNVGGCIKTFVASIGPHL